MAAINQEPHLFHSVLFMGVPFGCGVGYLRDMTLGSSIGINTRSFNPFVLFSHGSSFWTFPHDGEPSPYYAGLFEYDSKAHWVPSKLPVKDFASPPGMKERVYKSVPDSIPPEAQWGLKRCSIDLYRAEDWVQHQIGPFGAENREEWNSDLEEKVAFLRIALEQGLKLRAMVKYHEEITYPPITVVSGNEFPTLVAIIRNGPLARKDGWDFDSAPKIAGDGRIPFDQSYPDERIPCKRLTTALHHQTLLSDLSSLRAHLVELLDRDSCR